MKLELNVKRFDNEDVIATSGLCEHKDITHYLVTECNRQSDNKESYYTYSFNPTTGKFKTTDYYANINELSGVNSIGWYYKSGDTYIKCEDQSDEAHPVQPN